MNLGVVGPGGLGHMAVKLGKARRKVSLDYVCLELLVEVLLDVVLGMRFLGLG